MAITCGGEEMTPEEKQELERQRCEAKIHCKECWGTLQQLNKIAKGYLETWNRWNKRFEAADRRLAEEERLIKCPGPGERRESTLSMKKLSKAQILAIVEELEEEVAKEEWFNHLQPENA